MFVFLLFFFTYFQKVLQEIDASYAKQLKPNELSNRMQEIIEKLPLKSKEDKQKAGISDDLIRYAVGIEDVNDIIDDLKHGLEKC